MLVLQLSFINHIDMKLIHGWFQLSPEAESSALVWLSAAHYMLLIDLDDTGL